jgi:hypothetical protein
VGTGKCFITIFPPLSLRRPEDGRRVSEDNSASEVTPHLATLWMHILVLICKRIKLSLDSLLQIFLFGGLLGRAGPKARPFRPLPRAPNI